MGDYKYSNEYLLDILKKKASEYGRSPKKREVKIYYAICERFGSWNKALVKAGLKPIRNLNMTCDDYKKIIIEWYEKNGRPPKMIDFINDKYLPDPNAIKRKLKMTWTEILKECKIKPNLKICKSYDFTNDDLLKLVEDELQRLNTTSQCVFEEKRKENVPCIDYIVNKLGKWTCILEKLNLIKYKKNEVIYEIKNVSKRLGYVPSLSEIEKYVYNEYCLRKKFGTYNDLLDEAGLKHNITPEKISETKDELLKMYKGFCVKIGKIASSNDLNRDNSIYNSGVFTLRFGGMQKLKKLAGFHSKEKFYKYSKEIIIIKLVKRYKDNNGELTLEQIRKDRDLPAINTILRYFNTTKISNVWKEIF